MVNGMYIQCKKKRLFNVGLPCNHCVRKTSRLVLKIQIHLCWGYCGLEQVCMSGLEPRHKYCVEQMLYTSTVYEGIIIAFVYSTVSVYTVYTSVLQSG